MKIGLVANQGKQNAVYLAEEINIYLKKLNIETVYCKSIHTNISEAALLNNVDYIIVLGGDGTILELVRNLENKSVPVLGINFGTLGFIAETNPEDYKIAIDRLISGDYYISERVMLKGSVFKENQDKPNVYYCLNEFIVSKLEDVRPLSIDTYINNNFLVNYKADGIIVACSTGSTAYNLSAGGPVIHPQVKAYAITPICPHTLNERPLIVPTSEVFTIKCAQDQKALFSIDGQQNETFSCCDYVKIESCKDTCKLVEFSKTGFYEKLKTRLFWGK